MTPTIPDAPIVPLTMSDSNHSSNHSATDIGRTRRTSIIVSSIRYSGTAFVPMPSKTSI